MKISNKSCSDSCLLPCPFCGHLPEKSTSYRDTGASDGHSAMVIKCTNRQCRVSPCVAAYGPSRMTGGPGWIGGQSSDEEAEILVTKFWNTRHEG